MAHAGMHRTIPALPVRGMDVAVAFYLAEKPVCSGAESFIAGTASTRIEVQDVDALYEELAAL